MAKTPRSKVRLKRPDPFLNPTQYHAEMVYSLKRDPSSLLKEITPAKLNMLHMTLGLLTELGELANTIKRHIFYSEPINRINLIEEMGDMEFYHEGMRQQFMIPRFVVIDENIRKLRKRYPKGSWRKKDAKLRLDKKGTNEK